MSAPWSAEHTTRPLAGRMEQTSLDGGSAATAEAIDAFSAAGTKAAASGDAMKRSKAPADAPTLMLVSALLPADLGVKVGAEESLGGEASGVFLAVRLRDFETLGVRLALLDLGGGRAPRLEGRVVGGGLKPRSSSMSSGERSMSSPVPPPPLGVSLGVPPPPLGVSLGVPPPSLGVPPPSLGVPVMPSSSLAPSSPSTRSCVGERVGRGKWVCMRSKQA